MGKHTVVASTLAGMVAAVGCMSAHATFIYLQGAVGTTAVAGQVHHATPASAHATGVVELSAPGLASHEGPEALRPVRHFGWAPLPAWWSGLAAPGRETRTAHAPDAVSPAVDILAVDVVGAAADTGVAISPVSGNSVPDISAPAVAVAVPKAPAEEPDAPGSGVDAVLVNADAVEDSLIGSDVQTVPDPSSVGLLGVGLLLTFFASSRVRRRHAHDPV